MVADVVQDGEPVARRGLRIWAVCPKLGQHTCVVPAGHHVGRIGVASGRIDVVTWAGRPAVGGVVQGGVRVKRGGVRRAVANRRGADVPHHPVGGVQHARPKRHHAVSCLVNLRGSRAVHGVQGRLSRIVVDLVIEAVAGVGVEVFVAEGPRRHLAPFRRQEWWGFSWDDVAALVDEQIQREGLPPVQIFHGFVAVQIDNQGGIHRFVHRVGVPVGFVGPVLKAKCNQLFREVVAKRPAVAARVVRACEVRVVAQDAHVDVVADQQVFHPRGVGEAVAQQPVHPEGDGFIPSRLHVGRWGEFVERGHKPAQVLTQECRACGAVHDRPHVPHQHGAVPQVSGVHRGPGKVGADAFQQHVVPLPCHAVVCAHGGV